MKLSDLFLYYQYKTIKQQIIMTTFIQSIALVFGLVIMILVAKWQVNDDIKKMEKRLDNARKESNNN